MAARRVYKRDKEGQFARTNGPGANSGLVVSQDAIREKMGQLDKDRAAAQRAGKASQAGSLRAQSDELRSLLRGTSAGVRAKVEPGSSEYIQIVSRAGLLPKGSGAAAVKGKKVRGGTRIRKK